MADKAFKLTELVLKNGSIYTVGAVPAHYIPDNLTPVSSITTNRADKAFNGGLQVPGASYTVAFQDSPERRVIPFGNVDDFGGVWVDASKKADEDIPDLPEA